MARGVKNLIYFHCDERSCLSLSFLTTSYSHDPDRTVRERFPGSPHRPRLRQGGDHPSADGHLGGLLLQAGDGHQREEGAEGAAPDGHQRPPHPCDPRGVAQDRQPGSGIHRLQEQDPTRVAGVVLPVRRRRRREDGQDDRRGGAVRGQPDGRHHAVHPGTSGRGRGTGCRSEEHPDDQSQGGQAGSPGRHGAQQQEEGHQGRGHALLRAVGEAISWP